MLDAKKTIATIKVMLGMEKAEAETKVEFKDVVSKDGVALKIDKLEVGGAVTTTDADGNDITAVAGTIELEDGSQIIIDDKGIITEYILAADIKPMDAAADVPATMEPSESPEDAVKEEDKGIAIEDRVANLEKAIEEIMTIIQQMASNFEKKNEDFANKIEVIENETIATPAVFAKSEKKFEEMNSFEKFMYNRNLNK